VRSGGEEAEEEEEVEQESRESPLQVREQRRGHTRVTSAGERAEARAHESHLSTAEAEAEVQGIFQAVEQLGLDSRRRILYRYFDRNLTEFVYRCIFRHCTATVAVQSHQ
jgi:hypothetical protein